MRVLRKDHVMFKGYYEKRPSRLAHEFVLYDESTNTFVTFEFKTHKDFDPGQEAPATIIRFNHEGDAILKALAEALVAAGILPETATVAELRAVKYHLEDMRKLGLKCT